jgi:hypothetical protein
MLVSTFAFLVQATMIMVSQVSAATGSMPQPAVFLSGSLHYHDPLARHVHVHHGEDQIGHVHGPFDHDEGNATPHSSFVTLGVAAIVLPEMDIRLPPVPLTAPPCPFATPLIGVSPDGLNRPPSTPDIA